MTTFLLIRHGLTDAVGHRLTGRLPGLHLNETGRRQAAGLPDRLARWKIDAIYSSPLERTQETSAPLSERLGLPVTLDIRLAEFDFGRWSGMTIAELEPRHDWQMFCKFRSGTRAPGGELIGEVEARMVTALDEFRGKHEGQTVAVFSHADAIKAALMSYLAVPTDFIHRLDIVPASISTVRLEEWGAVVAGMNLSE